MRKITALITLLSLLALAGCQSTASKTPAAPPRPTSSPTPAPVQVSLFAVSNQDTVVALNPADGSMRWQHSLGPSDHVIDTFQAVQDAVFIERDLTITALNASDGKERWHVSNSGRPIGVGDGIVLTLYGASTLTGLSTANGKQLWSLTLGQGVASARIIGDVVYATLQNGPSDASLYALDARDGKERWRFQQSGTVYGQAVTQDTVYVTVGASNESAETLFALNQSDGKEQWHLQSPGADFFTGPTEVNGVVYVALDGHNNNGCGASPIAYTPGTLDALSASAGTLLWQSQPSPAGVAYAQPAVDQSVIYSADEQSGYAFNTANGQQLWSAQLLQSSDDASIRIEQPIISGNLVYLSAISCGLSQTVPVSFWALDKSDGHVVWQYQSSQQFDNRADPLVFNGAVYVTTATGGVEALNGSDGTQLWQNITSLTSLTSNAA